jgi:hypothetical protein
VSSFNGLGDLCFLLSLRGGIARCPWVTPVSFCHHGLASPMQS